MPSQKIAVVLKQLCRSLANDEKAQDHGLLGASVGNEFFFELAFDKRAGIRRRLPDMFEIVRQPVLTHIGRASVST